MLPFLLALCLLAALARAATGRNARAARGSPDSPDNEAIASDNAPGRKEATREAAPTNPRQRQFLLMRGLGCAPTSREATNTLASVAAMAAKLSPRSAAAAATAAAAGNNRPIALAAWLQRSGRTAAKVVAPASTAELLLSSAAELKLAGIAVTTWHSSGGRRALRRPSPRPAEQPAQCSPAFVQ